MSNHNVTQLIFLQVPCVILIGLLLLFSSVEPTCVKWGNMFDVSLESGNVHRDCKLKDGRPMCCSAVDVDSNSIPSGVGTSKTTLSQRGVGFSYYPPSGALNTEGNSKGYKYSQPLACTTYKEYMPSPLELRDLEEAHRIERIPKDSAVDGANPYVIAARQKALLAYVYSSEVVRNSTSWLNRIKVHMNSANPPPETQDDREFLSRFQYTRVCYPAKRASSIGQSNHSLNSVTDTQQLKKHDLSLADVELVDTWNEWIEPLTITARHPFGFDKCHRVAGPHMDVSQYKDRARIGRSDVDYVLLQSGAAVFNQTHHVSSTGVPFTERRIVSNELILVDNSVRGKQYKPRASHMRTDHSNVRNINDGNNRKLQQHKKPRAKQRTKRINSRSPLRSVTTGDDAKHYMFDAGTSTFDSSLYWFTCGYSQRHIGFDQVFGWEMTLLEPTEYWRRVPDKWKPYWHFYNTPITYREPDQSSESDIVGSKNTIASTGSNADSPLRFIRQLAGPHDFVAFKLDIDHPSLEMPVALEILNDPTLHTLVDEFFFELHFRCEVMTSCGWGKAVPAESHGLRLDRSYILKFFADLRRRGIRAHIWP